VFRPNETPSSSKFVQWAPVLSLFEGNHNSLLGLFNFGKVNITTNQVRQKVTIKHWNELNDQCKSMGLITPTAGAQNSFKVIANQSGSKRKRF